jgi:hypothetical protein
VGEVGRLSTGRHDNDTAYMQGMKSKCKGLIRRAALCKLKREHTVLVQCVGAWACVWLCCPQSPCVLCAACLSLCIMQVLAVLQQELAWLVQWPHRNPLMVVITGKARPHIHVPGSQCV